MKNKIDFLGIGVQKAGTTWLFSCLKEHPEISIPKRKELHFFNRNYKGDYNFYNKHFDFNKICGEITPMYIFNKDVPNRIFDYNPDIKLIVIFRDPTERAISQYKMEVKRKIIQNTNFYDSFINNLPKYGPIKARGFYKEQLERYDKLFPKENILILQYNDIKDNSLFVIKTVYDFLNIDSSFIPKNLNNIIKPEKTLYKNKIDNFIDISENDIKKVKNFYKKYENRFKKYLCKRN